VHTHVHTYIYTHIHTNVQAYINKNENDYHLVEHFMSEYTTTRTRTRTRTHTHTQVCVCLCVCVCVGGWVVVGGYVAISPKSVSFWLSHSEMHTWSFSSRSCYLALTYPRTLSRARYLALTYPRTLTFSLLYSHSHPWRCRERQNSWRPKCDTWLTMWACQLRQRHRKKSAKWDWQRKNQIWRGYG